MRWCRLAIRMTTLATFVACSTAGSEVVRSTGRPRMQARPSETRDETWRFRPPAHAGSSSFAPPAATEFHLASGIRVIVVENHVFPLAAVRVIAPRGTSDAPTGKQGLAYLVAQMLAEGSMTRDAPTLGRDLARLGANLTADIGADGIFVTVETMVDNLESTLDLLTEVLRRPRLNRATLAKVRALAIPQTRAELARGGAAGLTAVSRGFLGGKVAEAYPSVGDEAGLSRIRLADITTFYRTAFDPRALTVVVAGDVTAAEIGPRLESRLGNWAPLHGTAQGLPARVPDRLRPAPGHKVLLVDRPDAAQVVMIFGIDGIDRTSPDWASLEVMNHAFGGMYASRVNMLLREAKGYTYGFRSFLVYSHRFGQLSGRTALRPDAAVAAIDAITSEMKRFLADPPRGDELERARRVLVTQAARRFTSNRDTAAAFDDIVLYGLPLQNWVDHVAAIDAVDADDVLRVGRGMLAEDRLIIALVGHVGGLRDALVSRGFRVESLILGDPGSVRDHRHSP